MGKRKSSKKAPPKKKQEKLGTVFSCPFCNHDASVECKIDKKDFIGRLNAEYAKRVSVPL